MKIMLSDHFTYKNLLRFTFPTVIMMVFISVYGVVDGFFVSNYAGKTAFAAINLIMPFVMVLGGMGFMIGTGGTALVSKVMGEGDSERANRLFSEIISFTVIFGAVLSAVGVAVMRPVSVLLGATPEMIDDCVKRRVLCKLPQPLRPDLPTWCSTHFSSAASIGELRVQPSQPE